MSNSLLLLSNLAALMDKLTRVSTYSLNILPYLTPLNPTRLAAKTISGFTGYSKCTSQ
ncbi:hypothetical protein [Roseofilum casamattae]|uniref:Uncharacterized protein n=1 Tax=Roseofilum casamattae BLCC-M143 TaxID=3022442 RepID=A0ABT7BYR0_9CYAN|nr:hypothetical protein [Roseofilum casamattae]MDJ1184332.1 hypothetical protein [Roseofilum casamattae BLCC-M143]